MGFHIKAFPFRKCVKVLLWFFILTQATSGAAVHPYLTSNGVQPGTNFHASFSPHQALNRGRLVPEASSLLSNATDSSKARYVRAVEEHHVCSLRPGASSIAKDNSFLKVAYLLIFVVGVLLNGTILFIYWKHPEMRTKTNALFVNMAVADTLFLLVHLGIFKIGFYFRLVKHPSLFGSTGCRLYVLSFVTSFGMNAYSVAAISAQRYFGLARFSGSTAEKVRLFLYQPFCFPWLVWTLCLIAAVPEVVLTKVCNPGYRCYHPHLFTVGEYPLILYGILPTLIIVVFYVAAERRLKTEVRKVRSGKVLLALSIVYIYTYTPMLLCEVARDWFDTSAHHEEPTVIYCYIAKVIFHLNPTCNPLAICVASFRFRKYFKKYLLCSDTALDGLEERKSFMNTSIANPL